VKKKHSSIWTLVALLVMIPAFLSCVYIAIYGERPNILIYLGGFAIACGIVLTGIIVLKARLKFFSEVFEKLFS
jgi:hypothetical protein